MDLEKKYGENVNTSTHKQAQDVYKIARTLFSMNSGKVYILIKNDDITYKITRISIHDTLDAIGYQSMDNIETAAVHNRMIMDGYVFIEHAN